MKSIVVAFGKNNYLLGMDWQNHKTVQNKKQVIELANKVNLDEEPKTWVASKRNETIIQTGFAAPVYGGKPKRLYSLAGTIADMHEQPWIGRFKVSDADNQEDEIWWLVAIRDGHSVLFDGDCIGTHDEILAKFQDLAGLDKWNKFVGDYDDIKALVDQAKPGPSKVWLAEEIKVPKFAIAGVTFSLLVAGLFGYHLYQSKLSEQRLHALKVLADARNKQPDAPKIDAAYLSTPEPLIWLAACKDKLGGLKLVEKGWDLSSVECGSSAATYVRKRSSFATVAYRPAGALTSDNEINSVVPLALAKPTGNMNLPALSVGRETLLAWAQKVGVNIVFDKAASDAPTVDGKVVQKIIPRKIGFTFVMPSTPLDVTFADQLSQIDGLRLTTIARKVSSSDSEGWAVKGAIYGN